MIAERLSQRAVIALLACEVATGWSREDLQMMANGFQATIVAPREKLAGCGVYQLFGPDQEAIRFAAFSLLNQAQSPGKNPARYSAWEKALYSHWVIVRPNEPNAAVARERQKFPSWRMPEIDISPSALDAKGRHGKRP